MLKVFEETRVAVVSPGGVRLFGWECEFNVEKLEEEMAAVVTPMHVFVADS